MRKWLFGRQIEAGNQIPLLAGLVGDLQSFADAEMQNEFGRLAVGDDGDGVIHLEDVSIFAPEAAHAG